MHKVEYLNITSAARDLLVQALDIQMGRGEIMRKEVIEVEERLKELLGTLTEVGDMFEISYNEFHELNRTWVAGGGTYGLESEELDEKMSGIFLMPLPNNAIVVVVLI